MAEDFDSQHRKSMIESCKMESEVHKTQATLATGTIIAIAALARLLVPDKPHFLWMFGASAILILFSIGWSLSAMLRLTTEVMILLHPQRKVLSSGELSRKRGLLRQRYLAMVGFSAGVGLFAAYVWFNALV